MNISYCSLFTCHYTAENDDFTAIDPPPPSTAINEIEFAAGGTSPFVMTVMIDTVDDAIGEGDETFFLTITGVTGPATIVNSQATLTILEDDSKFNYSGDF